ncbi:helix-turn-helix transcriptional regulator [Saccharopolyspora taberi]|uniref:HTH cro/C1-type domain-containing protein n=1 Tax=Saccharopolyspora taberi TaxID=60895 RepID=A0ABN3VF90_9PSEU
MFESFGQALRRLRLAAGLSQPQLARRAYVSQSSICRYENDKQTPDGTTAQHLDDVLDGGGALVALAEPADVFTGVIAPDEHDRPVDSRYVDSMRETIHHLVALDGLHGGNDIAGLAVRLFRTAHRKLSSRLYERAVERDFEAVTGEMGELAGWLLYDTDRQDESRTLNLESLTLSRMAGDRAIELFTLSNWSMQSLYVGRPREALRIVDTAMDDGFLSPRVTTLLRIRRARALADLGAETEALAEMSRSRTALSDGVRGSDPAWTWWVGNGVVDWNEGMLCAGLGNWSTAVDWFSRAAEHFATQQPRWRYENNAHLLEALIRVRDWSRAETVTEELVSLAADMGSDRVSRLLQRMIAESRRTSTQSTLADMLAELDRRVAV